MTAKSPSKFPVSSDVKFNFATPAGKSVVETDVTGYLKIKLPWSTSSSELLRGV